MIDLYYWNVGSVWVFAASGGEHLSLDDAVEFGDAVEVDESLDLRLVNSGLALEFLATLGWLHNLTDKDAPAFVRIQSYLITGKDLPAHPVMPLSQINELSARNPSLSIVAQEDRSLHIFPKSEHDWKEVYNEDLTDVLRLQFDRDDLGDVGTIGLCCEEWTITSSVVRRETLYTVAAAMRANLVQTVSLRPFAEYIASLRQAS